MKHARILIVEDDPTMGKLLVDKLEAHGLPNHWEQSGTKALETFDKGGFHLCLLDIMLPGVHGLELARQFKQKQPELPIIFLTARNLKADKLAGYQTGCDDYITKPFEVFELILKIKALLARVYRMPQLSNEEVQRGELLFRRSERLLKIQDKEFRLTPTEVQLLELLLDGHEQVVPRSFLLERIWGRNDFFTSKCLDTYLSKLRKHFKHSPNLQLENIHGLGYVLRVGDKTS